MSFQLKKGRYRRRKTQHGGNDMTEQMSFMEEERRKGQNGVLELKRRLQKLDKLIQTRRKTCHAQPANSVDVYAGDHEKAFKEGEAIELDYQRRLKSRRKELRQSKFSRAVHRAALGSNTVESLHDKSSTESSVAERMHKQLDKFTSKPEAGKRRGGYHSRKKHSLTKTLASSKSISNILAHQRKLRRDRTKPKYLHRSASETVFNASSSHAVQSVTRKVSDVFYCKGQNAPDVVVQADAALRDVLQRVRLPKHPGNRAYMETQMLCDLSQQLTVKMFWFAYCKYFQADSETQQDTLIQDMCLLYASFIAKLTFVEKEMLLPGGQSPKDHFFRFYPFMMSEAVLLLLRHIFPVNTDIMDERLRDRLDIDFSLLIGGVQLTDTTHKRERERIFRAEMDDLVNERKQREKDEQADSDSEAEDAFGFLEQRKKKREQRRRASIGEVKDTSQLTPLEQDYLLAGREKYAQTIFRRVRPRLVKFNTNLITPVLQSGLKRPGALPTWNRGRMVNHPMPYGDSWLGGEDTFFPWITPASIKKHDSVVQACIDVRSKVRAITHDALQAKRLKYKKTVSIKEVLKLTHHQ